MNNELWQDLEFSIKNCKKCGLCNERKNAVVGTGKRDSSLLFIGEAPGEDEDKSGEPFVGKAGKLLTKIFQSVSLEREDVYITNIVKCRPPGNRTPNQDEMLVCYQYLEAQIALINPKLIVTIGTLASKYLLSDKIPQNAMISKIRGKLFNLDGGIQLIPIFHPSFLLRNTATSEGSPKWLTWQDMKNIKREYDRIENESF